MYQVAHSTSGQPCLVNLLAQLLTLRRNLPGTAMSRLERAMELEEAVCAIRSVSSREFMEVLCN